MKRDRPNLQRPDRQSRPATKPTPQTQSKPSDKEDPNSTPPFSQAQLGRDLRAARKSAGLTLQGLSRASGYSVTHLSQVERGQACPTMRARERISQSLGLDIREFLEPGLASDTPLVRRAERPRAELAPPHVEAEFLAAPIAGGALFATILRIAQCGPKEPPAPVLADGPRWIYVLRGSLELTCEGVTRRFETGDAYCALAGVDRYYRNLDAEPCELLVISLAPLT
jgi:transcriptional regulator with XRE-family HTH domain